MLKIFSGWLDGFSAAVRRRWAVTWAIYCRSSRNGQVRKPRRRHHAREQKIARLAQGRAEGRVNFHPLQHRIDHLFELMVFRPGAAEGLRED